MINTESDHTQYQASQNFEIFPQNLSSEPITVMREQQQKFQLQGQSLSKEVMEQNIQINGQQKGNTSRDCHHNGDSEFECQKATKEYSQEHQEHGQHNEHRVYDYKHIFGESKYSDRQDNENHSDHSDHSDQSDQSDHSDQSDSDDLPKNMKVFVLEQIVSGDYFLNFFLQLPLMPQVHQNLKKAREQICKPMYFLNNLMALPFSRVPILKSLLGGIFCFSITSIGFATFYIIGHYFLYQNFVKIRVSQLTSYEIYNLLLTITFAGIGINYFLSIIIPPGYLGSEKNKKEFEQMINRQPELANIKQSGNYCIHCQTPKVFRSQHCINCGQCILRYENHSVMLNVCLGAYNFPFYVVMIFFVQLYFWLMIFTYFFPTKEQVQKSMIDLPIIVIGIHQLNYFTSQFGVCLLRILYNITSNELSSWEFYPYLWKNEDRDFENPFDQGFIENTISFFRPILNLILRSQSELPTIDWGTVKFINVIDIPDHPLKRKYIEAMKQQVENESANEKFKMKNEIKMQDQKIVFRESDEDMKQLLELQ